MIERIKPKPLEEVPFQKKGTARVVLKQASPEPEPKPRRPLDKPLVRVAYIPGRTAYLIAEGPDQSELQWTHNGNIIFISNVTDGKRNWERIE
jgi:predicted secreted protein